MNVRKRKGRKINQLKGREEEEEESGAEERKSK